ncbi:MAG: hypothetical protein IJS50_02095, partial [Desulfovibrio sp.]|nr:hypothetical protein [Desulfovibrio sp.]
MFEKYSSLSPSKLHPLSLQFALSSFWHLWATFFGAGLLRPCSGTWGTLAACLVFGALHDFWS